MTEGLKVLYLDHFNRHGGAQEYILDLARAMGPLGIEAFMSQAEIPSLREYGRGLRGTGFSLLSGSHRAPKFYWRFLVNLIQVRRLVAKEGIGIIHCNSIPTLLLAKAAGPGPRIVATCHDFLRQPLKLRLLRTCPDRIISVSESVRRFLAAAGVTAAGPAIHNGFRDEAPQAPPARPSGPVRIGLVARLVPWKGCDLFLDAVALLRGEDINAEFSLIGGFESKAYARKIQDRLPGLSVAWHPFSTEKRAIYGGLDVVVNASIEPEPFGRTLVEAGMFRLPSIGPAEGGPAEIILDGVTGLTFTAGNAGDLARAMKRLIGSDSERKAMGGKARSRYLECFTMEAIASRVVREAYR